MTKLVLASGSPRRAEMMARITKDFIIVTPDIDEEMIGDETPAVMVRRLAMEKAYAVIEKTKGRYPVLAADTIVVHDRILGKP